MADLSKVPTFEQMLWPTLEALKAAGGSASSQELFIHLIVKLGLAAQAQTVPHGTGRVSEAYYRASRAWTYLRLFGALEISGQGVWSITKAGREMTRDRAATIPDRIKNLVRQLEYPIRQTAIV